MDARDAFDPGAYLRRIGYTEAPPPPTRAALFELQRRHLLAVPFENLDIHLGRRFTLDEPALFDKLVRRRRGGFCYEVNGLFARLLTALGYGVTLLAARVYREDGSLGPERDHLALLVACEGRWLVDVGFGDAFVEPLSLDTGEPQRRGATEYRVRDGVYAQRGDDGAFRPQYELGLAPHRLSDFADMCQFHQTSPDSPFTKRTLCTRLTETGRLTLRSDRLITTAGGERTITPIAGDAAWQRALLAHFGVDLALAP